MKTTKRAPAPFPDPPAHFSERSQDLWRRIGPREARSLKKRVLFQAGLEALDRADEARAIVAAEGMVLITASTGTAHVHPAVKIERESRGQFLRIWTALNLQYTPFELDEEA